MRPFWKSKPDPFVTLQEQLAANVRLTDADATLRCANKIKDHIHDDHKVLRESHGAIIPSALTSILSAALESTDIKTRNGLLSCATAILEHGMVRMFSRHEGANLSLPLEIWLPSLSPDNVTEEEEDLLDVFCEQAFNLSQPVQDLCTTKLQDFSMAAARLTDRFSDVPCDEALFLSHLVLTDVQKSLHSLRNCPKPTMKVIS